jgi:hypothetical protein
MSREEFSAGFRGDEETRCSSEHVRVTNAVSDLNPDPQSAPPYQADEQHTSASDNRAGDASPANDDVQIDASTADALRFWLRLVALS